MAKVHQLKPSQKQVEDAVRTLLSWTGDDPDRKGLKETPSRLELTKSGSGDMVRTLKSFSGAHSMKPRATMR